MLKCSSLALLAKVREHHLFFVMLGFCLAPIWLSGQFFVTGDGPCHMYNARVLLDFIRGQDTDFYRAFYTLNVHVDPNWLSHLVLAFLQIIFTPAMAEKIFLSGYILLFGFGLRRLIHAINPQSMFLSTVGMLFAWHHLLQSGFYNYALGIAVFFWINGTWLRTKAGWTRKSAGGLAVFWLLAYATHPMGLAFSMIFVGAGTLCAFLSALVRTGLRSTWLSQKKHLAYLILTMLPMLILFAGYLSRYNLLPAGNPSTVQGLLNEIAQVKPLMTLDTDERGIARFSGYLILLLTAGAIYLRRKAWRQTDFILIMVALAAWMYLQQAGSRGLELMMPQRIHPFIWLGLLLWTATATFPKWTRRTVTPLALAMMLIFLFVRLPILSKASDLVEEYYTCGEYLEERSVVLVINHIFNGVDRNGQLITNRNWIFIHAADYLGAHQPLILSDNYEALRNYFPLRWVPERNLYTETALDGVDFENRPPRADILGYNRRQPEYPIDYVLVLDDPTSSEYYLYTREIETQLDSAYTLVFTTTHRRAEVWKRSE